MEYIEGIVVAFGAPATMIGMIAFWVWFNKKHTLEHKVILQRLCEAEKHNETIAEDLSNLYKMSLRSCIVNQNIPVSARIDMYDTYKAKGFNSWIDQDVEENLLHIEPEHDRRDTDK